MRQSQPVAVARPGVLHAVERFIRVNQLPGGASGWLTATIATATAPTALSLVADDGAKVRESLSARAASLRRRELADLEGQAGEKSQSMLVAQMLLIAGFLIFLTYPVVGVLLSA